MTKRAIVVALATTGLLAAASASAAPAGLQLYFLSSSGRTLLPVVRGLPHASARAAAAAVVAGPTARERYTLTGLPGIRLVRFSVDGRAWGVWNLHSQLIRDCTRATLPRRVNACAVGAGGCFSP